MVQTARRTPARHDRILLAQTWDKAWAKTWLQQNTTFRVPATFVCGARFDVLAAWLRAMPDGRWVVVKPHTCSRARGVRIVFRNGPLYQGADLRSYDLPELLEDLATDLPSPPSAFNWMVEEYICPPPPVLAEIRPDGLFNPLIRNVMVEGTWHFGELHVPTLATRGRGTLRGGARRICFDWAGVLRESMPPIPNQPPADDVNYGVGLPVSGRRLPNFEDVRNRLETEIAQKLGRQSIFTIDGCYNAEGEFIIIEIEHKPRVMHTVLVDDLRKPAMVDPC